MIHPDSPQYIQELLARETVLSGIDALLEGGALEDETDRRIVEAAVKFIENPTENLSDIMLHTTEIGQVLGGYEMQGASAPSEIEHAMVLALDWAIILSNGYRDDTLLSAVNRLDYRLNSQ